MDERFIKATERVADALERIAKVMEKEAEPVTIEITRCSDCGVTHGFHKLSCPQYCIGR